MSLDRLL